MLAGKLKISIVHSFFEYEGKEGEEGNASRRRGGESPIASIRFWRRGKIDGGLIGGTGACCTIPNRHAARRQKKGRPRFPFFFTERTSS